MKYILILADGAADEPLAELGEKTPLEVANKPNLDRIAREGRCGMLKTVDDSLSPGSDVANMSILGYDPMKYYTGRGAIEALSRGIPFKEGDLAYRCNLVTVENGKMKDFAAGHISSAEGAELFEALKEKIPEAGWYSGVSYRNVMMLPNGKGSETTAPHDIVGEVINDYLPKGEDAERLMNFIVRASDVFENHPVNKKRIAAGKNPATTIWPWSGGSKPAMPAFSEKYHKKGAVISAVDLLFGLAKCAGMEVVTVPGATGYLDTNFLGKAQAAVETANGDADFVYMHVEATDEAGHLGSLEEKIKAIENLDKAIGYILDNFDGCIMLMPDHPTPIAKKTHTNDLVPFAIRGLGEPDDVQVYSEKEVQAKGSYGHIQAVDLLDMVFKE